MLTKGLASKFGVSDLSLNRFKFIRYNRNIHYIVFTISLTSRRKRHGAERLCVNERSESGAEPAFYYYLRQMSSGSLQVSESSPCDKKEELVSHNISLVWT